MMKEDKTQFRVAYLNGDRGCGLMMKEDKTQLDTYCFAGHKVVV